MKTLAQYLAEYLDNEEVKGDGLFFVGSYPDGSTYFDMDCLRQVLKEGMDAYMSTENCEIIISPILEDSKMVTKRPEIVTNEHLVYLDDLQESGITNMFGVRPHLMDAFSIDKSAAKQILAYWIESFGKPDR